MQEGSEELDGTRVAWCWATTRPPTRERSVASEPGEASAPEEVAVCHVQGCLGLMHTRIQGQGDPRGWRSPRSWEPSGHKTLWPEPCPQPVARKGRGLAVGMGRQAEGQGRTILPQLRDKLVRGLV